MNLASILLHYATEFFPLGARFRAVHLRSRGHVRIFLIHHIEIIRWTHQHVRHTTDGRRRWRAQQPLTALRSASTAETSATLYAYDGKSKLEIEYGAKKMNIPLIPGDGTQSAR